MNTEINDANETQEANEVKAEPPKKKGKAGHIIFAVLAACCLIASLGLNIYQAVVPSQKSADFIDYILARIAEEEKKENEYIEDGYKVGGEYEIRSTTHISDAYKSGDDSQLRPGKNRAQAYPAPSAADRASSHRRSTRPHIRPAASSSR